jgi:multicomponent Na+:H+ antiporter subunit G
LIAEILVLICLIIGLVFNALAIIGLIRFPDVYTRMHATTKATTFGTIFLCIGVVIYALATLIGTADLQYLMLILHTIVAMFALAITNAVGAHALARAAHRNGQMPTPGIVDRLAEANL